MIVDDLNLSEGVTIEKTEDSKTIYTSEFGDRVIEYVNNVYKNKQTITDSSGINSYVYTIEKEDITDTSCKLISTLSINLNADFSEINEYSDNSTQSGITEENADYTITLKVGQKCKIETSREFQGYELQGSCVEIDTELAEITAIKKGTADGYLFVGDEKKSIYITVKENEKNETLNTIKLELDETNDDVETNEKNEAENEIVEEVIEKEDTKNNNTIINDNTVVSSSKLPKAGYNNLIFIIITFIICIVVSLIKFRKYKDIK